MTINSLRRKINITVQIQNQTAQNAQSDLKFTEILYTSLENTTND